MNNFIETNKIISYNLKATYLTHDVNMTITIDALNNTIVTSLNGNTNIAGSYISFYFDNAFTLQNEEELAKVFHAELLAFIKQIASETKLHYSL